MVVLLGLLLGREAAAFYNPQTGRWLSRDPIGEKGGANLFAFAKNAAPGFVDDLGRAPQATAMSAASEPRSEPWPPGAPPKTPTKPPPHPPGTPQHPGGGQCPGNPPDSNGCGTEGWKGKLVPEMPFWMISFTPACNAHDLCYGTCGKSKAQCDANYRDDMYLACYMKWGRNDVETRPPIIRIPRPEDLLLSQCTALADAYYLAVSKAGGGAYDAGQKQGCKCLCNSKKP